MHTFRIKIGNMVADIQSNHAYIEKISKPYLSSDAPTCSVSIDESSLRSVRISLQETQDKTLQTPNNSNESFLEVYALLHKLLPILPEYDMLFLHGSAISYEGKAYIFVAPSGTGKSTHSRLWKERFGDDVTVINDDKPFLAFRQDRVYVCGTPWRGKHNIGQNLEVELAGICILSQGEQNVFKSIDPSDAVKDIILQTDLFNYKQNVLLALDLIDKLLRTVPAYRLACTPTIDAVDVCFHGIIK